MTYSVKEIFYTLQGEGGQAGRAAVFCRFAGCNLWTGREKDRAKAICQFCDTDFVGTDGEGGGKFATAQALADKVKSLWPDSPSGKPLVIAAGGYSTGRGLAGALATGAAGIAMGTRFSIMRWRMPSTAVVTRICCGSVTFT